MLDRDPHPVLAALRAREPASWIPALDGWLVTRYDLALEVMRDAKRFTVDDPRFSTARVVGPSMLSLDHSEHARHRAPFVAPFRARPVHERFDASTAEEAQRLVDALRPAGAGELRRSFAGPFAAAIITRALGLAPGEAEAVLGWYDSISATVTEITAGMSDATAGTEAFAELGARLQRVVADDAGVGSLLAAAAAETDLSDEQIISNAAVLLFGGIETTEGMIANAALHLLTHADVLSRVYEQPQLLTAAIEESLRLEPAAAVIDRYATEPSDARREPRLQPANSCGSRSPGRTGTRPCLHRPTRFDLGRGNSRRHLAFAHGPHVCVGVHLARLEARSSLLALLEGLPGLRLDPDRPSEVRGLVFRKPVELNARWNA